MSSHSSHETSTRPPAPTRNSSTPRFLTHASNLHHPLGFFHPTRAEFEPGQGQGEPWTWNSRASRKNRFTSDVVHVSHHDETTDLKHSTSLVVEQRLKHPETKLKPHLSWDISFWVAVIFVLGSTAWIVNGFYLFLPLVDIGGEHLTAAAWWAFAGGTLFELGSYLMLVEALNTGHDELFGPALWGLLYGHRDVDEKSLTEGEAGKPKGRVRYRWIGLGDVHDLGYLACAIQMFAATIFWISTITGIPHVIPNLTSDPSVPIADIFYWTPQVIGGTGFIISSILLMLEVQTAWWKPNLTSIGWHIAVWNLIGAMGFTLCGALGYAALGSTKANYQSVLSTFWGSFAFEIGSVIQLWETLWREDPAQNSQATKETSS